LKQLYEVFHHRINASEFGWNEEVIAVTAADDVWEEYLKVFTSHS